MKKISGESFNQKKELEDELQIVDVREAVEYQAEHLPGSVNVPLSGLSKGTNQIKKNQPVYLLCQSGARSEQAAKQLHAEGYGNVVIIEGGLECLKPLGCKTLKGKTKTWAMDRQVRMGAGTMVLLGILGSWFLHPGFLFLSAFVACGLIFSAITNTCGMALALGKCPWNQIKK